MLEGVLLFLLQNQLLFIVIGLLIGSVVVALELESINFFKKQMTLKQTETLERLSEDVASRIPFTPYQKGIYACIRHPSYTSKALTLFACGSNSINPNSKSDYFITSRFKPIQLGKVIDVCDYCDESRFASQDSFWIQTEVPNNLPWQKGCLTY